MARSLYQLPKRGLLARFLYDISPFVRACAAEMHMDMTQKPFDRRNPAPHKLATRFVRAWAVEGTWSCHKEPCYAEIYRKNAAPQDPDTCHKNHFMRKLNMENDGTVFKKIGSEWDDRLKKNI